MSTRAQRARERLVLGGRRIGVRDGSALTARNLHESPARPLLMNARWGDHHHERRHQPVTEREVAVTGIGISLPNCDSPEPFWRFLEDGASQLAEIPDPSDPEQTVLAGRVDQPAADRYLEEVPVQHLEHYSREVRCYLSTVLQARSHAGLRNGQLAGDRVGIYDGSSRGAVEFWDTKIRGENGGKAGGLYTRKDILNAINGQTVGIAAALFRTTGPALAVAGSCAAGLIAAAQACRDIEDDRIDTALATGHDLALTPGLFAMYGEAGLLRREANSPGASCGEGASRVL